MCSDEHRRANPIRRLDRRRDIHLTIAFVAALAVLAWFAA
jgi:hypothetical protein